MSREEFERFREIVFLDLSLRERLLRLQKNRDLFFDEVIKIGDEHGFKITVEDIKEEMARNRRLWTDGWT